MTPNEIAAYEAGWDITVAEQNAAWIAKWGLPPVDPATAARAAAKDKEWAEFLAAAAAWEAEWVAEMEWEGALAEWTSVWRLFSKEKPE